MKNVLNKIKDFFKKIGNFIFNHKNISFGILVLILIIVGISFICVGVSNDKKNKPEEVTAKTLENDLHDKVDVLFKKNLELETNNKILTDQMNDLSTHEETQEQVEEVKKEIKDNEKKMEKNNAKMEEYKNQLIELQYIDSKEEEAIKEMNKTTSSPLIKTGIVFIIVALISSLVFYLWPYRKTFLKIFKKKNKDIDNSNDINNDVL